MHSTPPDDILRVRSALGECILVAAGEQLIAAFAGGTGLYYAATGSVAWLDRPAASLPGDWFDDGRVDRRGRSRAGTRVEGDRADASGCLYSIGVQGLPESEFRA